MIININREYFSNYILDIIFVNFNTSVYYLTNGAVANGEITNYATEGTIRVDLTFGMGYADSIEQAKRILYDLMKKQKKILDYPAAFVGVVEPGDSSVNLAVRPYTKPQNYSAVCVFTFINKAKMPWMPPE